MRLSLGFTLPVAAMVVASCLAVGCGSSGPGPGPIPNTPSVVSISPNSGTTLGGTVITVTGTNFAAGAQVTVGGAATTNVIVTSSTTLTATTSTRSAGTVEVTVTLNGRAGSLPAAFTYVAPGQITNEPPVIQSITARGTKANEPPNFADLSEEITVTGTATDAESAADRLVYEWSGTDGAFTGTGPSVTWRAPASGATPFVANLKLTVVDRFQTTDGSGLPITFEHRVEKTFTVKVHDSVKEVGTMAQTFLEDFSRQELSPEEVVRNFTDRCVGKADELTDVRNNQWVYDIIAWSVQAPVVTVSFGGRCPYQNKAADACADVAVDWTSRCLKETKLDGKPSGCTVGEVGRARGNDQVTARYLDGRWWLCDSNFDGSVVDPATGLVKRRWVFKR